MTKSSNKVRAYRIVRKAEPCEVNQSELVSIKQAASELGIAQSGVSRMLDAGALPVVQLSPDVEVPKGFRAPQRFTLRSALETLKKVRAAGELDRREQIF